jgi:hypothetical protein
MIIVKLFGGLGNQLFQYAIGRKLSLLHNTELRFDLTDFYKYKNLYTNMSVVGVDIKKFKVNFNEAVNEELKKFFFLKSKFLTFLIKKISSRFFSILNSVFYKVKTDKLLIAKSAITALMGPVNLPSSISHSSGTIQSKTFEPLGISINSNSGNFSLIL